MKTKPKKTVLVIHDDRALLRQIRNQCRRIGLEVRTATKAIDAFAIMDQRLPDLVCLDVNIPTGHELSFCQMMATDPLAAKIPVIAITDRKDAATVARCGDMCAYYLPRTHLLPDRLEPVIYELIDVDPPRREHAGELESR